MRRKRRQRGSDGHAKVAESQAISGGCPAGSTTARSRAAALAAGRRCRILRRTRRRSPPGHPDWRDGSRPRLPCRKDLTDTHGKVPENRAISGGCPARSHEIERREIFFDDRAGSLSARITPSPASQRRRVGRRAGSVPGADNGWRRQGRSAARRLVRFGFFSDPVLTPCSLRLCARNSFFGSGGLMPSCARSPCRRRRSTARPSRVAIPAHDASR